MFDDQKQDDEIVLLSKEAVAKITAKTAPLNLWRVLRWQVFASVALTLIVYLLTAKLELSYSVLWGGVCVLVPGALFARAIVAHIQTPLQSGLALIALGKWELVKVILTIGMLLAAPKVINNLSWLALFAGFVVTIKVYWLACFLLIKNSRSALEI